jgi:hypothetical protein
MNELWEMDDWDMRFWKARAEEVTTAMRGK